MRIATTEEITSWNELLANNPDGGDIFQAHEFSEVKRRAGWKPHYLISSGGIAITVHEKAVPLLGKLWYIPRGPGVSTADLVAPIAAELHDYAKKHHKNVFAIKIEPALLETEENISTLKTTDLLKVRPIQPNSSTVILDISADLESIMSSLNQKGRHAIRRAERDGVMTKAVECNEKNMHTMFELLQETASGRFNVRPSDYYKTYWQSFAEHGTGQLFFAYNDEKVVAGAYAMYLGQKGTYKDGASSRKRTAYGASHLLQWEVIKWMKTHGVTSHDLCGAPHSSKIRDESNPHYGLGRFKTSFNKHVTDFIGAYDIIVRPNRYKLWSRYGQSIVIRLNSLIHHQYWY